MCNEWNRFSMTSGGAFLTGSLAWVRVGRSDEVGPVGGRWGGIVSCGGGIRVLWRIDPGTYLFCCGYLCVLIPVNVEQCVPISDGFRSEALGNSSPHTGMSHLKIINNLLPFPYLSPSLSIFSLLALDDLFLLPLSILSCVLSLPDFNTVCTFHAARAFSVYLVLFCPSTINPSSCFLCSTFVTIFFTVWGC
jgi:hypothetical protein